MILDSWGQLASRDLLEMWALLARVERLVRLGNLEQLVSEAVVDYLGQQEHQAARVHKVQQVNLDQGVTLAHQASLDRKVIRAPLVQLDPKDNLERKALLAELDPQDLADQLDHQDHRVIPAPLAFKETLAEQEQQDLLEPTEAQVLKVRVVVLEILAAKVARVQLGPLDLWERLAQLEARALLGQLVPLELWEQLVCRDQTDLED